MGKLGFRVSSSFVSFVHCVFFCGVRRSIEQSDRGLQVVRVVVAVVAGCRWSRVAVVADCRLKVDSYESASRVYGALTSLRRLASLTTLVWIDLLINFIYCVMKTSKLLAYPFSGLCCNQY